MIGVVFEELQLFFEHIASSAARSECLSSLVLQIHGPLLEPRDVSFGFGRDDDGFVRLEEVWLLFVLRLHVCKFDDRSALQLLHLFYYY